MSLVCVTNDVHGVRSCTVKGEHAQACTGWKGDRQCAGCLPRPAEHGMLCWSCWERLNIAWNQWGEFITVFAGVDRAVQRDNAGVRGSIAHRIPLSGIWLSIDAVERFMVSFHGSLDEWVSKADGAADAVKFLQAAQAAFLAHPVEEKPHRLKRQRCTKCSQLTLWWHPPQFQLDHVRVVCADESCGHEMDQRSFETLAMIEGR